MSVFLANSHSGPVSDETGSGGLRVGLNKDVERIALMLVSNFGGFGKWFASSSPPITFLFIYHSLCVLHLFSSRPSSL